MKKRNSSSNIRQLFTGFILVIVLVGGFKFCQQHKTDLLKEIFQAPTLRQAFLKKAKKSARYPAQQLSNWDSIYQQAFHDTLRIGLPHRETLLSRYVFHPHNV